MRNTYKVVVGMLAALLVACAAPRPPLVTASGNPEVTIQNVDRRAIVNRMVEAIVERGNQVRQVTDYSVTAVKRVDRNFGAALLYGSRYDSVPEARLHFTLVDVAGGVRVFARAEMVTNPGSAFERVNDVTLSQAHDLQGILERMRQRMTP